MPRVIVTLALVAALAADAAATPAAQTLVLVDPPPALVDAVTTGLSPWQIEIVVVARTADGSAQLAAQQHAGFVATLIDDRIDLFDVTSNQHQERPVASPLDDVAAAAIALTIKTWMRLGPAPTSTDIPHRAPADPPLDPGPRPAGSGRPWRFAASAVIGFRGDQGGGDGGLQLGLVASATRRRVEIDLAAALGTDVALPVRNTSWRQWDLRAVIGHHIGIAESVWVRPNVDIALIAGRIAGVQATSGQRVNRSTYNVGLGGGVDVGASRGEWLGFVALGLTWVPVEQELHGAIAYVIPRRIEPRIGLGFGRHFP
jgi:hypothetical protein